MAFTKVSLTGTIDTIKAAFTAFNTFIDDLLSTANGKGASQVGIEDTAGNFAATNVETALAEVYTDHANSITFYEALNEDPDTTVALTWGYKTGSIRYGETITDVAAGTVSLTNNTTNYIEVNAAGTVSKNTTGFTVGETPLRTVVCAGGVQTVSTDKRKWLSVDKHIGEDFKNLSFTATVAAKALTIALKGENGNDPSATNTGYIKFRSATLTSGVPVVRTVTGALSAVLSSGSTLGFTAALAGRIYIWAIDNAGTVELAFSRAADIFPECNLVTTTAEGGAGAADSATVMYSTTARANVACRCLGYIEITTGAVAGEWDNAPTKLQVIGPGVKRAGDIVQIATYQTGAVATGTTNIPVDDTIPQITEGDEYMTLAVTPTSAINKLIINVVFNFSTAANVYGTVALFQDAVANALACTSCFVTAQEMGYPAFTHTMTAGTTSAITFRVRAGLTGGNTLTFNGLVGARLYGDVYASSIVIKEVFV